MYLTNSFRAHWRLFSTQGRSNTPGVGELLSDGAPAIHAEGPGFKMTLTT